MYMNRERAAELGQETVRIIEAGSYTAPLGRRIDLRDALQFAKNRTCNYPPEHALSTRLPGDYETRIEVTNETTLAAAERLVAAGHRPAALNFASAKHPGGGFLSGARPGGIARPRLRTLRLSGRSPDVHAARDPI